MNAETAPLLDTMLSLIEAARALEELPQVRAGIATGPALERAGDWYGNTVNLASRVQGLTKYLKCPLLVTAATRQQLGDGFVARRVVRTRVGYCGGRKVSPKP